MCGIAGWLGTLPDSKRYAERIAQILQHRGPDEQGFRLWPGATLVHTRLSIIDLSPTGAQPMANEDGTVWTVFNGEIYNHHELRRRLESRGHRFKGHSDTEVLPHLYEEQGPAFVTELRGMFALALYDLRSHTLILARDRFGIKPLFYAPGRARLAFASEIRALLELPEVSTEPDRQAIYDFAALFYIPAPETFYSGIRALLPGEVLEAQLDTDRVSWKTRTYHHWVIAPDPTITIDEATHRTDALLHAAVSRQLESDVPLGTLLSGGIDSSLVSAAAQTALNGTLRTFNVRFSEKEYDETPAAVAVAEHIGSHHHTLDIDENRGTWEYVQDLLLHAGQPFADTSLFALHGVCRLMRHYVTVVLSGDGGDEGFGGYDFYWWLRAIDRWQALPQLVRRVCSMALDLSTHMRLAPERLAKGAEGLSDVDNTSTIQYLFCRVRGGEHERLCRSTDLLPLRRLFEPHWEHHLPLTASRLERLAAHATEANIRLQLANDFLFKVDTASMKESLEVRVPLLDEELFAFGLSLPHSLKVKGWECKRVLRRVAQCRLPLAVANKPKHGFSIPFDTWIDAEFKVRLREALLHPSSRLPEFFRPEVYCPIVEAFCRGRPYPGISRWSLYQRAVMLLSVHLALSHSH